MSSCAHIVIGVITSCHKVKTTIGQLFARIWWKRQNVSIIQTCTKIVRNTNDNKSAFVQVMAWRQTGDKSLLEPMLTQFTDAYMRLYGETSKYMYANACSHLLMSKTRQKYGLVSRKRCNNRMLQISESERTVTTATYQPKALITMHSRSGLLIKSGKTSNHPSMSFAQVLIGPALTKAIFCFIATMSIYESMAKLRIIPHHSVRILLELLTYSRLTEFIEA